MRNIKFLNYSQKFLKLLEIKEKNNKREFFLNLYDKY